MNRVVLPPKKLGETVIAGGPSGISFLSQLGPTETISTAVCTATVWSGVDASPGAIISGLASISGSYVSQKITGGLLGVIYYLLFTITTSLGQTLQLSGFLAVVPDTP